MIATITNTTNTSFTLPLFNEWMTPYEVFTIRRSFANFNDLITGPRGTTFLYLVEIGLITVNFEIEPTDSYVPFVFDGVKEITAGTGLLGGTITESGTISVNFGTTAGTVCAGNDPRLTGAASAPGGPYAYPYGTPVAIAGGGLVPADASNPAAMPCVGIYTGSVRDSVITEGEFPGLAGLTPDAPLYVAEGGGFAFAAPSTAGSVSQYIGRSLSSTAVYLTLMTPIYE